MTRHLGGMAYIACFVAGAMILSSLMGAGPPTRSVSKFPESMIASNLETVRDVSLIRFFFEDVTPSLDFSPLL